MTLGNVAAGHSGTPLTGKIVALLAGLSAISSLSTNIILPAFADIGQQLGVSSRE
ncbi:Bcr/CflA family drug resistance efflux transporter, partial [Pseudomonas fragi]|nr:Bcr/CflA family drug resistance efflux transporter [Pseudomonas sp. GC01]